MNSFRIVPILLGLLIIAELIADDTSRISKFLAELQNELATDVSKDVTWSYCSRRNDESYGRSDIQTQSHTEPPARTYKDRRPNTQQGPSSCINKFTTSQTNSHKRFQRKAHYHCRRVQNHVKHREPRLQANSSWTTSANINEIYDKNFIQPESIKRHIWNLHKFLHMNNTHKGIIVEDVFSNVTSEAKEKTTALVASTTAQTEENKKSTNTTYTTYSTHSNETTNTAHSKEETTNATENAQTKEITKSTTKEIHVNTEPTVTEITTKKSFKNRLLHPHIAHKTHYKYDLKKPYYMPLLIVADKNFLDFHRYTDYETYILTIMNIAAESLHDLTLGVNVELSIVRTIYVEESSAFDTKLGVESLLENFCNWTDNINREDIKHPSHHDVAILLTRREGNNCGKPCDALGYAYLGGACLPYKSCIVVQDIGLLTGINVAHQLGHLLGALDDDGSQGHCPAETPGAVQFHHVMAPFPKHGALVWSHCSKQSIVQFFRDGHGDCLEDEPSKSLLQFSGILPGVMYNASYQCHLLSLGSKACYVNAVEPCSKLYCHCDGKLCKYSGERPAQGTHCGSNKWCYNGACVQAGERPGSESGGWGAWGKWEACSRTCGGGVRRARRPCDSPAPVAGGRYCLGEADRYSTCNIHACSPDVISFRALQCGEFDKERIAGQFHVWTPLPLQATDPCGLFCKSQSGLKVRLRPRMHNGTPCRKGTKDLCINGICTRVGCDWVIGSGAEKDRCDICGGDGSHCHQVVGWYNHTNGKNDVELVTTIPKDSRKITIYEACKSANTLAVTNTTNKNETEELFLIGNKNSSFEGAFPIKTIYGTYTHARPGEDLIRINGPLPLAIRIYVVLRGNLSPIHYSYMNMHIIEHVEHATTEKVERLQRNPFMERHVHWTRYQWDFLEWSRCTSRCEVGTSVSVPYCISVWFGRVSDSYCNIATKPRLKIRVCNERPCALRWRVGPWSPCVNCMQWRAVHCVREARSYLSPPTVINEIHCDALRPVSVRQCASDADNSTKVCGRRDEHLNNQLNYGIDILDKLHSPDEEITTMSVSTSDYDINSLKEPNLLYKKSYTTLNSPKKIQPTIMLYVPPETTTPEITELMISSVQSVLSSAFGDDYFTIKSNTERPIIEEIETITPSLLADEPTSRVNLSGILSLYNTTTDSYKNSDSYGLFSVHPSTTNNFSLIRATKQFNVLTEFIPTQLTQYNLKVKKRGNDKTTSKISKLKKILFTKHRILKRDLRYKFKQHNNTELETKPVIEKFKKSHEDVLYLIIRLAKSIIPKLNEVFNGTKTIDIILDNMPIEDLYAADIHNFNNNKHKMDRSLSVKNIYNLSGVVKPALEPLTTKIYTYTEKITKKTYDFDDIIKRNDIKTLSKHQIDLKPKRPNSNEFVTKIPLKIFTSVGTIDGFKKKHTDNEAKQLDWLPEVTSAPLVPKKSSRKISDLKIGQKLKMLDGYPSLHEREFRNCLRNLSKYADESQRPITIYCTNFYLNMNHNNISRTPTQISDHSNHYKNQRNRCEIVDKNPRTVQEYPDTNKHLIPATLPDFVDITLQPKHKNRNNYLKEIKLKFKNKRKHNNPLLAPLKNHKTNTPF